MSGVGSSSSRVSFPFATFSREAREGRKSAGAAALITMVDRGRASSTARRISSVVSTRTSSAPHGAASDEGPEIKTTRAPRWIASSATAYPIRPEDGLVRTRAGSTYSRVGPAVTSTVSPAHVSPRERQRRISWAMASGSGSRPLPISPQASSPASGSMSMMPRLFRTARLA